MKSYRFRILYFLALITISSAGFSAGLKFGKEAPKIQDTISFVSPYEEDNQRCFICHGQQKYEYTNESLGRQVKGIMCLERIVNKTEFYDSNHKNFSCTDCHSGEYVNFPHAGELRMEQKFTCLDCHGGDETYAQYHFEEVDTAYQKSTHYKLESEGFSCWSCHDPHSYKIRERSSNIKESIRYDNSICLNCHSDFSRYQLLSDNQEINIISKHDWLPNQASHFASVRCIECHTKIDKSIRISHQIMPKEEAVKLCNECHSQNSLLMASLYKFESKEQRRDGFFNGTILNESYVIGANRNEYLNMFSLIIFFGVLVVIVTHIFFRVRKSSKQIKEE